MRKSLTHSRGDGKAETALQEALQYVKGKVGGSTFFGEVKGEGGGYPNITKV